MAILGYIATWSGTLRGVEDGFGLFDNRSYHAPDNPEGARACRNNRKLGYTNQWRPQRMSKVWSDGYFTATGYTYGYYRETSPVYQRFCLLLRGLASYDADAQSVHCELGCGQGVSVNINAAANPGQFIATDFNPAHAAHARSMAVHAGRGLRLFDDSFEQLLARDDLPEFDSISLHGVWSWVSRDNQRSITKFVSRYLKPGGLLYISYNCFPGWVSAYPLRHLFALHDRCASGPFDPAKRIDAALKFSETLLAADPLFARATVGLDKRLAEIANQNRDYLGHEFFNRDWNCMYFMDMVDTLAEAKLDFATTAEPLDVVDTINLTAEGIAFLNSIEHPVMREQIRDYFVNRQFRKDLYLRGVRRLSAAEQCENMLATRLVLERAVKAIPMKTNGPYGEAALQEDIFRPLLDELATRDYAPKSFKDLLRALPAFSLSQMMMAGAVLVGAGHAAPCQAESAVPRARENCDALNKHLLDRARNRDDIGHLASPITGAGIVVDRLQQLFLTARNGGYDKPSEWAHFAWKLLIEQGRQLIKEGKPLETPDENLAELMARASTFLADRLPILRALGIA
jgi:SAM-dependent methyltransferase